MTHDEDPNPWAPSPAPSAPSAPSEWTPPASSLPAPPPAPRTQIAPLDTVSVTAGPAAPPVSRWSSWVGRAAALAAAAVLVGGGAFLAVNAGGRESGAGSPADALAGAFDALANEDLIGAAEFIEPVERETMIAAGFDVIDELVRLEVFDSSIDLSDVEGIDFEFAYTDLTVVEVTPDLAQIYVLDATVTSRFDGAAVPLGALITDRVDAEDLAVEESGQADLLDRGTPIAAVRRDGRWYLSLWYSVAENARLAMDAPFPNPADRVTAIGGDTPQRAIENLVAAIEQGDLASAIGLLDPEETSALYDYAPLFLDDAQSSIDEGLQALREDGWSWDVTGLELTSAIDGRLATVSVDAFGFTAGGPNGASLEMSFTPTTLDVSFVSDEISVDIQSADGCTTSVFDDGWTPETETVCEDELAEDLGLSGLFTGGLSELQSATPEFVLREVDGRWYLSPVRTGSTAMLGVFEAFDADALAEMVDSVAELFDDTFVNGSFATDPFGGGGVVPFDDFGEDALPFGDDEPFEIHHPLVPAEFGSVDWTYDLFALEEWTWSEWLSTARVEQFDEGVVAGVSRTDGTQFEIMVLTGLPLDSDDDLGAFLGGVVTEWNGHVVIEGFADPGPYVASRYNGGVLLVGDYGQPELTEAARELLGSALGS